MITSTPCPSLKGYRTCAPVHGQHNELLHESADQQSGDRSFASIDNSPPHTQNPSDAGMTLATLSAWLPLPHPDASMETLTRLLSPSIPRGGDARDRSGLFSSAGSASTMVSLGPVLTRRGRLSRIGRGQLATAVAAAARVYSRKTVLRGFTASRGQQMDALEQVGGRIAALVFISSLLRLCAACCTTRSCCLHWTGAFSRAFQLCVHPR